MSDVAEQLNPANSQLMVVVRHDCPEAEALARNLQDHSKWHVERVQPANVKTGAELADHISETAPEDGVYVVLGGDGLAGWVAQGVIQAGRSRRRIVPARQGLANDFANDIGGEAGLLARLEHGYLRPIHTIEAEVTAGSHTQRLFALGYLSIGASAKAAAAINNPTHRDHRAEVQRRHNYMPSPLANMVDDAINMRAILRAIKGYHGFTYTVGDEKESRTAMELLWVNGHRMAKHLRFATHHLSPEVLQIMISDERFFLGRAALMAIGGRLSGGLVGTEPEWRWLTVDSEKGAMLQRDGDEIHLPHGSKIRLIGGNRDERTLETPILPQHRLWRPGHTDKWAA
jgi:hypothetical protein